jgi:hypothetical protein
MARADDLKKRMGKLWDGAVAQIEEVRDTVKARADSARGQLEKEVGRLKGERDKLVLRLGEQTLEWVNKSPVRLPHVVQSTVDRLNGVISKLTGDKKPSKKKKAAPKAKKAAVKKTVKKLSAKPAKSEAKAPKTEAKAAVTKSPANKAPVVRKPLEE